MTEDKSKGLISLAVKCRLITLEQERELLTLLVGKRLHRPEYTEIELLNETRSLSHEHIQFLNAVKEHLKMKMLDKRFGELGVANQLIRPENVKQALDLQNDLFRKTRQSKLIGEILFENKQISRADKAAILLTQDRIADDYLTEAMNDIATTEIEKLSLNMRFGAIAVKKGMITIHQLNTALKAQEEETKDEKPRRYLGEILKQLYDLSQKDLIYILKIQKELEKKRLSLETALSHYYAETTVNKRLSRSFGYRFSKNKLQAHVQTIKEPREYVATRDFFRWLHSIGITFGLIDDEKIQNFLTHARKGTHICIARGIAPKKGKDETVQYFFDTTPDIGNNSDTSLPLVQKGDVLARIFPARKGTPGKDTCGFTIAPPPPDRISLNCGQGVIRKNNLFIADTSGLATLYKDRTLFVQPKTQTIPIHHHTGWIHTDISNHYQDAILKVEGTISDTGRVRCRQLEIFGNVFGHVYSAGNIHVKGMIGQEKVGQKVQAKLMAEGEISASKQIIHAIIITNKSLKAPNADLVSSQVMAFQDIVVKNVVSDHSGPCTLQMGKQTGIVGTPFDEAIQAKKSALEELEQKNAFKELEQHFAAKIGAKDNYLAQHQMLIFFQALLACPQLDHIPSIQAKLKKVRRQPDAYPELPPVPRNALKDSKNFMTSIYAETDRLDLAKQRRKIEEIQQIKYGMYRAAVNASQRHNLEYELQKENIHKKIQGLAPDIQRTKEQIQALVSRRDAFLLRQELQVPGVAGPTVKVKNRVQQGTVIKGVHAALIVDQDMYGVKFVETRKTDQDPAKILIEGLYE